MVVRRRRPGNARGGESAAALLACGPSVTVSGCDVRSPTAWAAGAAVDGEAAKVPDGERVAAIAEVAGNVQAVMDGAIDPFITEYLKQKGGSHGAANGGSG